MSALGAGSHESRRGSGLWLSEVRVATEGGGQVVVEGDRLALADQVAARVVLREARCFVGVVHFAQPEEALLQGLFGYEWVLPVVELAHVVYAPYLVRLELVGVSRPIGG